MSAGEICWRVRMRRRIGSWRRRWARGAPLPASQASLANLSSAPVAPPACDPGQRQALLAAADALLAHRWSMLGRDCSEPTIDWHRDPEAAQAAPRCFAFDVPHRDVARIGDVKVIWEKNRHHHWSILAAAWRVSDDHRYADEVVAQWRSWMTSNPWMEGVNWSHPLEHGLRLIAWVWSERLLRGAPQHAELFDGSSPVWQQVWWHQRFIVDSHSQGSSANNHLIGELAGCYVASLAWPVFAESTQWRDWAERELVRECERQTFASGLNKEQAWDYQLFVLEFIIAALLAARDAGHQPPAALRDCGRRMAEAVADMITALGFAPAYGDGDDGRALVLGPDGDDRLAWLLQAAAVLCDAALPPQPVTVHALVAGLGPGRPVERPPVPGDRFADAGLRLLGQASAGLAALVDVGPLGFLSIAAHGHADALAVQASCDGLPLFIDTGTYVYHDQPQWRDWFRGTRAHNTICIDGVDQSEPGGTFLWTRHASCTLIGADAQQVEAEHDGYSDRACHHRRCVSLDGDGLRIDDDLQVAGDHRSCAHWHIHPAWEVAFAGQGLLLRQGDRLLRFTWTGFAQASLWRGGERSAGDADPADDADAQHLGWHAPSFGCREPITTIRLSLRHSSAVRCSCRLAVVDVDAVAAETDVAHLVGSTP